MRDDISHLVGIKRKKRINPWKYPTSAEDARQLPFWATPSPLLKVLSRGLPDLCYDNGICDIKKLAQELSITRQGVHKWVNPNRQNHIPARAAARIIELSKVQKNGGDGFVPLTHEDFLPFIF